jgi:prepilin-type N-terminal cleavage/methylation domain-containing protein
MKKGFTIIELMIVSAIIGILAAIIIPNVINIKNRNNDSADIVIIDKKTAEPFPEKKAVEEAVDAYDYNQWKQESKY